MSTKSFFCSTPRMSRPLGRPTRSWMTDEIFSICCSEADIESTCASSVFDVSDIDGVLNKNYKIGSDWKFLQPKRITGIYHDILRNPSFVYDVASKWVDDMLHQPEDALKSFVQLTADLCGYQNLDVSEVYTGNDRQLIKMMEKTPPDAFKSKSKYLVKTKTRWGRQSCLAVSVFVNRIIKETNTNEGLYEKDFWGKLFSLLKSLACSELIVIKHTGVFMATKFITSLAGILHSLEDAAKRDYITILIEFLLKVMATNCKIEEKNNTLDEIKVACINEMKKWFEIHPDYFFVNETLLDSLKYFCENYSTNVCEKAMSATVHLIRTANEKHFQIMLSVLVKTFTESLSDSCNVVVIKAIEFFIELLKRQAIAFINGVVLQSITYYIFGRNFEIAKAAGCLVTLYLHSCSDLTERKHFYVSLIKLLQIKSEFQTLTATFVESIIDFSPEIKMWGEMTKLLFDGSLNDTDRKLLFRIMHDSMLLCVTGNSPFDRTSRRKPINKNETRKLTDFYWVNAKVLAEFSWGDDECFRQLIELLSVLSWNEATESEISPILTILVDVFKKKDTDIVELVCKMLHANTSIGKIKEKIEGSVKCTIIDACTDIFHNQNKPTQFGSTKRTLLVCNIFYKYFNLNELNWVDLYIHWTKTNIFNNPYTEHHLINCQHYLTWKLKHLMGETDEEYIRSRVSERSIKCAQFFTTCFDIINGNKSKIHILAFRSVCELHVDFFKKIKPLVSSNATFEQLIFKIEDDERRALLKDFIEVHLFESRVKDEKDLYEKTLDLKRYLDMVNLDILPMCDATCVFKYFHSHNKRYGTILKDTLQNMIRTNSIHGVVLIHKTLTETYSKIVSNVKASRLTYTNLKDLVGSFNSVIKKADKTAMQLLQLAVIFAEENRNECYLNFMQPFVGKLTNDQKKKLCDTLNKRAEFSKLQVVRKFLNELK